MESLKEMIKEIEKEEILNALLECNWVMAKAAKKLGITERMIGYKVMKYGIRKARSNMKLIEAIVSVVTIDEVKAALQKIGIEEMGMEEIMVSRLSENGQKDGRHLFYRGTELVSDFVAKMKVAIIVTDDLVDKVIGTVSRIARMGGTGDCRIYVLPLVETIYQAQ